MKNLSNHQFDRNGTKITVGDSVTVTVKVGVGKGGHGWEYAERKGKVRSVHSMIPGTPVSIRMDGAPEHALIFREGSSVTVNRGENGGAK